MTCHVCGAHDAAEIFRQGDVAIWTDTSDNDSLTPRYRCVLHQCTSCGHVYQPVDDELRAIFAEIYRSANAQGTSPMGSGSWGMDRVNRLFFNEIDLKNHRSALEIGCGDGYLLSRLKERGFTRLVGIEPSVNVRPQLDGVTILNDFVSSALSLREKFDLIYSIAVFEHIEDVNGVFDFCRRHLKDGGELFFVVPNAQDQLANGDPSLFVHQHVQYFTERSLRRLLSENGFHLTSLTSRQGAFFVTAGLSRDVDSQKVPLVLYDDYSAKFDDMVGAVSALLSTDRVIVHGACNALNNIVGRLDADFPLADNDENKQGRRYFDKIVRSPLELELGQYDMVLVMTHAYFEPIRRSYVERGFQGELVTSMTAGRITRPRS